MLKKKATKGCELTYNKRDMLWTRSPLATKFIGGVLKDNLNERDWRTVLESNLFGQNSIDFVLGISYKVLPNHPQNCFTSVDPHNSNHA
ncbi:hypothetical protein IEQ34_010980 [Dendrobium chrysotoxum]|uniref:Uncharacterized protein n=1 Tax=Dendrobium chrysotoxum TaxID=161865 RepID=A0AAV7GV12_DENCH|nr:hypothetical protein IEQ34_010980 [Dendrobium chrysotoxum]